MAKFKTEFETDRNADQMRHVEVEIDFTSNALASILYRQGNTVVWHAVKRKPDYQDGFPEILPKDGFMLNIHYYQVQQIPGSEENVEALRGEPKKLND